MCCYCIRHSYSHNVTLLYPTFTSHEIITHAHIVQNEVATVIVIMASTAKSEMAKEDNLVLSSSSNTLSEIEGVDQIQRDGDLGQ